MSLKTSTLFYCLFFELADGVLANGASWMPKITIEFVYLVPQVLDDGTSKWTYFLHQVFNIDG